jgi:hypothetical protein
MNPYEPPQTVTEPAKGNRCPHCGSRETHLSGFARKRMNPLLFLFFGWMAILISSALSRATLVCRACEGRSPHRTVGSWISIGILGILALLIAVGLLAPESE